MTPKGITQTTALLIVVGLALAAPLAAALPFGVGSDGVADMKSAGATPAYGQIWVGLWMKSSGWGGLEAPLKDLRAQGITPVIMWYYWGDSISVDAVKYGKDGRTKGEWDAMARDMATRAKNIMGDKPFLVVLEPEFNKQGISTWETFDGYLADQARSIKSIAPKAQIVTGFGHWGGWDIFDRAMAESTYSGFQFMRASTRDNAAETERLADTMLGITKTLKGKFGKPVILYDLAIGTYGGWEGVQERALQRIASKSGELESAGLKVIVWRYVHDNDHSSGYFGPAESSWGVKTKSGAKKAGYDDLVNLIRGGGGASAPPSGGGSTTPPPSGGGTAPDAPFTNVKGNEWWIQANVAGGPSKVETRVNGGSWIGLDNKGWGWAVSTKAPNGATVELRATYGDGSSKTAAYKWPDATPVSGGGGGTTPPPSGGSAPDAPFTNVKGNEWWIQANVAGGPSKVEARVNGGSWVGLDNKGWGWAVSTKAPNGATVELKATYGDGSSKSASYKWPDGSPVSGGGGSTTPPSGGGFDASFSDAKGNEWWIQVNVNANQGISKVEVRVDGGGWMKMDDKGWGYTLSTKAPKGSKVEFRATSTSGATDTHGPITWLS